MVELHQSLALDASESQPLVEAAAVGRHQVYPFTGDQGWSLQQGLDDASTQPQTLMVLSDDHVPKHGPVDAIAGRPAKTHQPKPIPGGHRGLAAHQHAAQVGAAAPLSPEAAAFEQIPQLAHGPAGP